MIAACILFFNRGYLMKPAVWGSALGVLVIAGGAYGYLSYEFTNQVEGALYAFNEQPDNEYNITYGDVDTSIFSRSFTLTDLVATERNTKDSTNGEIISAKKLTATLGGKETGSMLDLASVDVNGISIKSGNGTADVSSLRLGGVDAASFMEQLESESFREIPVSFAEVRGFRLDHNNGKSSLNTFRFAATPDGSRLEEFLIENFTVNDPVDKVDMSIGTIRFSGGDLATLTDFARMAAGIDADNTLSDREIDAMAERMAAAAVGSFGVESARVSDVRVTGAQGVSVSLKDMQLTDVVRQGAMVVGMNFRMDDLAMENVKAISPQAAQIFTLAGMESLHIHVTSQSGYDAEASELQGSSSLQLQDLLTLNTDMRMQDVDLDAMARGMVPMQKESYRNMLMQMAGKAPETPDPQAELARMMDMLTAAYAGYYSKAHMVLTMENNGLNERGLTVYSALTGMPEDQLRQQFVMAASANMANLLGSSAPDNIPQVFTSYLATPSQPVTLSLANKAPLTKEDLTGMTMATWHQLFDIGLISGSGAAE